MNISILAAIGAVLFVGAFASGYHQGKGHVQAQWDAVKVAQGAAALQASTKALATERQQSTDFAGIDAGYQEAQSHVLPTIADTLPAAVATGSSRLRNDCPAAPRRSVPGTPAAAGRVDEAAATTNTRRIKASVSAVRVGDEADARERQLGAQVTSLQALLRAERRAPPPAKP